MKAIAAGRANNGAGCVVVVRERPAAPRAAGRIPGCLLLAACCCRCSGGRTRVRPGRVATSMAYSMHSDTQPGPGMGHA